MSEAILQAALAFKKAGIYPLRVREDGSKAPDVTTWKNLHGLPSDEDIHRTFTDARGVGVLTGRISGNLEMLEFEGRAIDEGLFDEATKRIETAKLGTLWSKLRNGYSERTPSGGFHLLYFVSDGNVPGNTKIAERAATPEEYTPKEAEVHTSKPDKVFRRTLIETRGDGGFVVTAPTEAALHKNGVAWSMMAGGPKSIPSITSKERNKLVEVLKTLDRVPKAHLSRSIRAGVPETEWERATEWNDILGPHGWEIDSENNGIQYWRHSGHATGHSATIGAGKTPDRLFVFSTSTEFEEGRYYSKAEAYAVLNNNGNTEEARVELNLRSRKPVVMLGGRDESELIDEMASLMQEANAKDPIWFEYGDSYVEINEGVLQEINKDTVGYLASQVMTFMAPAGEDDEDDRVVAPPVRVLTGMVAGKRLSFPKLRRISNIPFFTKSGKLWATPGYCEEAEVYYEQTISIPGIPPVPDEELVGKCKQRIRRLIEGFPFDGPDDESVWWSLLLLPFVRDMIDGPTPLHLFGAPTPGTGKTLCARVALQIPYGHSIAQSFPEDRFMEATLLSNLRSGAPYSFYDNAVTIKHPAFNGAITAYPHMTGRLLGGNTHVKVPNFGLWVITSNNPEISKEELRRSVKCWLDAKTEDPETDRSFDFDPIVEVGKDRAVLIGACLVIVQSWVAKGMPLSKERLGSFEQWAQIMGGLVGEIGLPSPVGDREAMKLALDEEGQAWKAFVGKWAVKMDSPIFKAKFEESTTSDLMELTTDLELPLRGHDEEGKKRSLGRHLTKKNGQIIAGYKLSKRMKDGKTVYRIAKVVEEIETDESL